MKASIRTRMILGVLVLIPPFVPPAASAAPLDPKVKFSLSQFIPQDCWLVIQAADNPERAFIDAHWARVFNALKGTGIGEDLKTLIFSGAPPEQRAQVEEGFTTAMKLLSGVNWGDLVGREMVFAERLTHFIPEIIVLCRSKPGSVDGNVAGLKAIMDQIATFSESLSVTESDIDGSKVWKLAAPNIPFAFFLLHRDDVVGLMLGEKAAHEIAALLAGKEAARSFAQNARFKKAIADLPPAENEIGYFDIKMLMTNLEGIFEMALKQSGGRTTSAPAEAGEKSAESLAPRIVAKVVDHFNFIDYVVFSTYTEGLQEFTTSDIRLQPSCTQKSLCKMFTDQKPFERFDKYVPKSATGFSLWNGLDLKELYDAILTFIKEEVPDGAEALAKWAELQQEMGFDVEADFFSWWSGEMISVTLPPAVKTPFSSSDSIVMVRVKDAKLASAKINAGLERLNAMLKEHNQSLIIRDETEVHAEGFRSVTHPMFAMMGKVVIGVADGHLIVGSSAEGINQCLDTAAGKGPSIVENPRFKAEGLTPKGAVTSASFEDLSNMGQEMAAMFFSLGFASAFIPDEEETKPIKAVFGMLSKLSPAINEINFYSSAASVTEFDGQGWRSRQIMTYKSMPTEATTQEGATTP